MKTQQYKSKKSVQELKFNDKLNSQKVRQKSKDQKLEWKIRK